MTFRHGLKVGQRISTYELQRLFLHNRYRGMRYSLTTNTLVVISDHFNSPYNDRWENGILYYNGMGLLGNQKLDFMQNKTLAESDINGVEVYLCEIFDNSHDKYIFMGRVVLEEEPFKEKQIDKEGNIRDVWVFPLKPIDFDGKEYALPRSLVETANYSIEKKRKVNKLTAYELEKRAINATGKTGYRLTTSKIYERNLFVSEFTKLRANGDCELCENPAPFTKQNGDPYLETHHINWLSQGGLDILENTVALCPNCHRKMHSLNLPQDIKKLKDKIRKYDNNNIFL